MPLLEDRCIDLFRKLFFPGKIVARILKIAVMPPGKQRAFINWIAGITGQDFCRISIDKLPGNDTADLPAMLCQYCRGLACMRKVMPDDHVRTG